MSAIFDYIRGEKRGKFAELEAAVEHTSGYLGVEIEENQKLRAALRNAKQYLDAGLPALALTEINNALEK